MNPSAYQHLSAPEAIAYQRELRKKVRITPLDRPVESIGGADISFNKYSETVYAGIIVLSYPGLKEICKTTLISRTSFPYIPGLLAFREVPALQEAWNQLEVKPGVLVLDGQGIAHPRRVGIATHFGLLTGIPAIGCAKSNLTGRFEEPANTPFAESEVRDKGELIGIALRTKKNCKPVFISPGHRIDFPQSLEIIKTCTGKYRIPEPTRRAHLLVNEVRRRYSGQDSQRRLF